MKKKRIILIAGGVVLLAAILCAVLLFTNKQEAFRTIQIYKIEGSAIVDRDGVGSIEAYNGMMMQSGDTVHTNKESCLYFKMDEDKFALLEPESTVRMEASGTSSDSKTVFRLEAGALVSRLDSKLSPNSVYEVNTPNSTMAVRGTIFRIEVTYDESGASYTNVYVFDGTVECQLVFKDGSVDEEVKQAQKNVMVRIRGDDTISEYILDHGTVDYGQLPVEVLEFLKVAIEEGVELPISEEELEAILAETEKGVHEHSGGTATCISPAVCASADCAQPYGAKDPANHTGRTEIRNLKAATCAEPGYTGDTYCLDCGEMIEAGSYTGKDASSHVGGTEIRNAVTADCKTEGYTGDTYCRGCGVLLRSGSYTGKDASSHVGGTKIRNAVTADCKTEGYTGDTYCLGCGVLLRSGSYTGKDASSHVGGTKIRNAVTADCKTEGYTGDTYCLGCGNVVSYGSKTVIAPTNHTGEEERRDVLAATCREMGYSGNTYCTGCDRILYGGSDTPIDPENHTGGVYLKEETPASCCDPGYTGDKYCVGCDKLLEKGTLIEPTGDHPAAACGVNGHHLHDGNNHAVPSCGTTGHCISDGLNHDIASCHIIDHHNCDGRTHGKICFETDAAYVEIEVIVTDNGGEWSFTLNDTVYEKYQDQSDSNQYFYYFWAKPGETVVITRTGLTGEFYASTEIWNQFAENEVLSFTLNEDEEIYRVSVFISCAERNIPATGQKPVRKRLPFLPKLL